MPAEAPFKGLQMPADPLGGVSPVPVKPVVSEAGRQAWRMEVGLRQCRSLEYMLESGVTSTFVQTAGLLKLIYRDAVLTMSVPTGDEADSIGVQLKFNFRPQGENAVTCEQMSARDQGDGSFVMVLGEWMELVRRDPDGSHTNPGRLAYRYDEEGVAQLIEEVLTNQIANPEAHRWMNARFLEEDGTYRPLYPPNVGRHKVIYPASEPIPQI